MKSLYLICALAFIICIQAAQVKNTEGVEGAQAISLVDYTTSIQQLCTHKNGASCDFWIYTFNADLVTSCYDTSEARTFTIQVTAESGADYSKVINRVQYYMDNINHYLNVVDLYMKYLAA